MELAYTIAKGSEYLARLTDQTEIEVNSLHHQALRDVASGLRVVARAPDGIVEAVELPGHPWFLGCQFHPEFKSRPWAAHPLFREFVKAARAHREKSSPPAGHAADTRRP